MKGFPSAVVIFSKKQSGTLNNLAALCEQENNTRDAMRYRLHSIPDFSKLAYRAIKNTPPLINPPPPKNLGKSQNNRTPPRIFENPKSQKNKTPPHRNLSGLEPNFPRF